MHLCLCEVFLLSWPWSLDGDIESIILSNFSSSSISVKQSIKAKMQIICHPTFTYFNLT